MATIAAADHVAFVNAAQCGDLSAVKKFFARPEVQANAALWENHFRERRLTNDRSDATRHNSLLPRGWFYSFQIGDWYIWPRIFYGHEVENVRWFFSEEGLALVGETLRALLLYVVANMISEGPTALERLGVVVESRLFARIIDEDERKAMLSFALIRSVTKRLAPLVDALLAYGADPNADYREDRAFAEAITETPLGVAISDGSKRIVDKLVAHGAWVDDDHVLTGGSRLRRPELIRMALDHGADANRFVWEHGSPFHYAADSLNIAVMETLVNDGFADFDARDRRGRTPLLVTASKSEENRSCAAEWLIDRGANVLAVDPYGRGVLHWVVHGKSISLLKLFLSHGADPNCRDIFGRTPATKMLSRPRIRVAGKVKVILGLLLEAGADLFMCDENGKCAAELLTRDATGQQFLNDKGIQVEGRMD